MLNALRANVRDLAARDEDDDNDDGEGRGYDDYDDDRDDDEEEEEDGGSIVGARRGKISGIKPEARLSPHLFVREGASIDRNGGGGGGGGGRRSYPSSTRTDAKREASAEILSLASGMGLPIVEVDKGVLNALCGSRPHQGYVLRCGTLDFAPARRLPRPKTTTTKTTDGRHAGGPTLWLALDEVVDPQNLGEFRSARPLTSSLRGPNFSSFVSLRYLLSTHPTHPIPRKKR